MLPALVVLVVVLAAAFIAERVVERRAPAVASRRLSRLLGLPVEVVTGGRGRDWVRHRTIPVVTLTANRVPVRDGTGVIDVLDVRLTGVRTIGRGAQRRVVAGAGDFVATIREDELRRLVDLPPLVRRLDLRGDRVRFQTTAGINVDARLSVEGGDLILTPIANPFPKVLPVHHRIRVDDLPAGARIERAVVRGRTVVASGPLDGDRLHGPSAA